MVNMPKKRKFKSRDKFGSQEPSIALGSPGWLAPWGSDPKTLVLLPGALVGNTMSTISTCLTEHHAQSILPPGLRGMGACMAMEGDTRALGGVLAGTS